MISPDIHKALPFVKKLINKKVIISLIVLFVVWTIGNRNAQNTSQIHTYKITPKTLNATVISSGKVRADQSTDLHFQTGGQIAWINAKQGDHVYKGQIIAALDTQVMQKQLKENLNTYLKTRLTFEDTKDSQQNQIITDTLKRIAQRSQADLENSVTDVEIKDLAIRFSTVASPIDGYIINDPTVYTGSNVLATDTITTVANTKTLQFLAETDETDIGKIAVGQKAKISLDAFPNKTFNSTVSLIAPQAITTSTGATAFNVTFDMDSQTAFLIGMNGSAEITTETKDNVLTIPIDATIDDNFVWLETADGKYQKKGIKRGLESDSDVEVISGLNENDTIVISGFDQLTKASLFQKLIKLVAK